jgi:hypothetical protein
VYNQSPRGLRPFGSVDIQGNLVFKNVNAYKTDLGPGQLSLLHEPAVGVTLSTHVRDPSDTAAGSTQPPAVTLHPVFSAQTDLVNYTFQKQKKDLVELKLTLAPQVDVYGNFAGTNAQFQLPIQPGIEGHLNKNISAVGQVSIPLFTKGGDNPPPSFGIGILGHF